MGLAIHHGVKLTMDIGQRSPAEIELAYRSQGFPEARVDRPYVVLNMVSSFDGSVTVADPESGMPSERGLGSSMDKRVMQLLRSHTDAVLNGAETLRASGSSSAIGDDELSAIRGAQGKPRNPLAMTLSRKGNDLPLDPGDPRSDFFYSREFEAVVFVTSAASGGTVERIAATGRHVEVISASDDNISELLSIARRRYDVRLLVCEGGPTINGALIGRGLADEVFMTFAPKLVGGGKHMVQLRQPFDRDHLQGLEPLWSYYLPDSGELFLRYRITHG